MNTQSKKTWYPVMDTREYERARKKLDLSPMAFAELLGVSWRQHLRYSDGDCGIPNPVAKLIRTTLKHDLTPEDVG